MSAPSKQVARRATISHCSPHRLRESSTPLGMTSVLLDASVPLQESMDLLSQLRAYPFRRRDLFHGCFAQAVHRAKLSQMQIFAVLAHARAIVENTFADTFFHQELVIRIREAMGLVANALQQTQRAGFRRQDQRQSAARPIDLFVFLRQSDDRQFMQPES